jgi:RHS repeat-associated protein
LGNVRLSYSDLDLNGAIDPSTEILEENNFYPFGLKQKGYNNNVTANSNSVASKFKYNGIEQEEAFGLNLYEMDFRQYDNSLGRFYAIDKLSEMAYRMTPYRFGANNPIYFADPSGLIEESVLMDMFNRSISGTTWNNDGHSGFSTDSGGYVGYTSDDNDDNTSPGSSVTLPEITVNYNDEKSYQYAAFETEFNIYISRYYNEYSKEEQDDIIGDFLSRVNIAYGGAGVYNDFKYKGGRYTQTNGKTGNFNNVKSKNASSHRSFSKALKKVGIFGTIIEAGIIINDFSDGTVKSSSIVNGVLMGVAFINPVIGSAVLIYSIGDYFFEFSGGIDENFGEHKLWD